MTFKIKSKQLFIKVEKNYNILFKTLMFFEGIENSIIYLCI